jgi:hypothetical protein
LIRKKAIASLYAFLFMMFFWVTFTVIDIMQNIHFLTLMNAFSPQVWFDNFLFGELSFAAVLYLISFTAIFLYASILKLEGKSRKIWWRRSQMSACMIIGLLVINIIVQTFMPLKLDLTRGGVHSISAETKAILSALEQDVFITYYHAPEERHDVITRINRILERYGRASSKVTLENRMPPNNSEDNIIIGSLVIESGESRIILHTQEFYISESGVIYDNLIAEQVITNAIIRVTAQNSERIGLLTGKGASFEEFERLIHLLDSNGMEAVNIDFSTDSLPENLSALLIINPISDFSQREITLIDEYLAQGGALQVYLDVDISNPRNLIAYIADNWGMEYQRNQVFERDPDRTVENYADCIIPDANVLHPISAPYARSQHIRGIATPNIREVTIINGVDEDIIITTLLRSSETSYAKNISNTDLEDFEWEEGDIEGPLDIAVIAEIYDEFGNLITSVLAGGSLSILELNHRFFLSALNWQTQSSGMLEFNPKSFIPDSLIITDDQIVFNVFIVVILLPGICIGFAIKTWHKRRKSEGIIKNGK